MRLVSVYEVEQAPTILWDLLVERPREANISHKSLPSWQEHLEFVLSEPYTAWYIVLGDGPVEPALGAIYLTKQDEIGLSVFRLAQKGGVGQCAVALLKILHPRERYFANVAPANLASQQFWLKQGFKPLQMVYSLEALDVPAG